MYVREEYVLTHTDFYEISKFLEKYAERLESDMLKQHKIYPEGDFTNVSKRIAKVKDYVDRLRSLS